MTKEEKEAIERREEFVNDLMICITAAIVFGILFGMAFAV